MTYIFCDIEGTYNILNESDKKELFKLIEKIDNTVYFSFISSADTDFISTYYKDIKKYTDGSNIKLLSQIGNYQYINELGEIKSIPCDTSKGIKMIYFQNSLELSGIDINNVIYMDDNANMYPLIYSMDNDINQRLKTKKLNFTIIEKDNISEMYCKDSIDIEEVKFISSKTEKFIIDGIKKYLETK